jgi:hypothetical protein
MTPHRMNPRARKAHSDSIPEGCRKDHPRQDWQGHRKLEHFQPHSLWHYSFECKCEIKVVIYVMMDAICILLTTY